MKAFMQWLSECKAAWKATRAKRKKWRNAVLFVFLVWYLFCLPARLFSDSTSTVLLDNQNDLLGAKIADDGQWRFPESDSVPEKFATCLIAFEDRDFHHHFGISFTGIGRAMVQNVKHGRIVSGGSTLTMQLSRIMRKNPPRTFSEKLLEMVLATRIEWRYSKEKILNLYASHAPFGNNVVGLEAASWRYFGRASHQLSWAECATLAVLPNAPGLIYPGKNQNRLLAKRDRLLNYLHREGIIDATTYELALTEPLPEKPLPLPRFAPHLLSQFIKEGKKGQIIHSTIQQHLQENVAHQLNLHSLRLQDNKIYNGAVLVTSVKTGEIVAYVGNTLVQEEEFARDVNCAVAPRSTGSILKPLLYAQALEAGLITPQQLVSDVPTQYGGFSPKNFSGQFDGALPIDQALSRSLNVPMVHLLFDYGQMKFHRKLKSYGISTLYRPARHYGLSLILGGAEAKLYDLSAIYTRMAQELRFGKAKTIAADQKDLLKAQKNYLKTDRACIYSTFQAMIEVNRPDEDNNWRVFSSAQKIAWKTGTSFGFRDAWAIGVTPDYVVAVWVGNADGEGRPGLTGINAAAPLLFDVFGLLPQSKQWFKAPKNEMTDLKICSESGQVASPQCPNAKWKTLPKTCRNTLSCGYHQQIHLNIHSGLRVDSDCESVYNMKHVTWFVLPSLVERFYKINHPDYVSLPEYQPECLNRVSDKAMALIYPKPKSKIYVPIEIDGKVGRTIFEATHRNNNIRVFWHLDNEFIGETKEIHQLSLRPDAGKHELTLIDENGIRISVKFEVVGKTG